MCQPYTIFLGNYWCNNWKQIVLITYRIVKYYQSHLQSFNLCNRSVHNRFIYWQKRRNVLFMIVWTIVIQLSNGALLLPFLRHCVHGFFFIPIPIEYDRTVPAHTSVTIPLSTTLPLTNIIHFHLVVHHKKACFFGGRQRRALNISLILFCWLQRRNSCPIYSRIRSIGSSIEYKASAFPSYQNKVFK